MSNNLIMLKTYSIKDLIKFFEKYGISYEVQKEYCLYDSYASFYIYHRYVYSIKKFNKYLCDKYKEAGDALYTTEDLFCLIFGNDIKLAKYYFGILN